MGQYYKIANLDKKEYLTPHDLGDGAKLMEFGQSAGGAMTALAALLADGNGRGGGDIRSDDPIIGRWAGDRIVITGDYADNGKFCPQGSPPDNNLYSLAEDGGEWRNISQEVARVLRSAGEDIGRPL